MPRNTTSSDRNEFHLHDNLSDSDIVLYYRNPTTAERQGYQNMAVQRRRNKICLRQAEARLHFGRLILTGFRDGDFVREIDGRPDAYSSDPAKGCYLETWKDELEAGAADLVMLLGAHVFDSSAEIGDDQDQEEDDSGEDAPGNSPETSPR